METKLKRLEIRVVERTTEDGRKFNAYHTYSKNGRRMQVKFRKEVSNLPTKDGYMFVAVDKMNIKESDKYPVVWIQEVDHYEDFTTDVEKQTAVVDNYFGD